MRTRLVDGRALRVRRNQDRFALPGQRDQAGPGASLDDREPAAVRRPVLRVDRDLRPQDARRRSAERRHPGDGGFARTERAENDLAAIRRPEGIVARHRQRRGHGAFEIVQVQGVASLNGQESLIGGQVEIVHPVQVLWGREHRWPQSDEPRTVSKYSSSMSRVLVALFALAVVSDRVQVGEPAQPRTHRLDLTDPNVVRTVPTHVFRESTEYVGKPTLDLPFEMRLVSISPPAVGAAPAVIYEVALKNLGTAPLEFPWSVDRVTIESGPRPFLEAVLALEVDSGDERPIRIGQEIIVGHRAANGSTTTLLPGDTAVIRVSGSLVTVPEIEDTLTAVDAVRVRATLRFDDGPRVHWRPLPSVNSQRMSFRRR